VNRPNVNIKVFILTVENQSEYNGILFSYIVSSPLLLHIVISLLQKLTKISFGKSSVRV